MAAALTFILSLALADAPPTTAQPPEIGAKVSSFTLPDIHRRPRPLAGYKDKQAIVVAFWGRECPLANLYLPTLIELHKRYAERGVQFIAVFSNVQDSFVLVSAFAQEREVPFVVLKDFDHRAADALGAARTPEVFLLDPNLVIRYRGRIDDQYGIGFRRDQPTRRDLQAAIDQLLAGKEIAVPQTEAQGCIIARASKPRVPGEVTYARQVSRLLQKHCQECHRPGEIGPMSLLTYEQARDWAATIQEVVLEERMPPWYADPRYGKFLNDRRLSRDQIDTLAAWVEQGCPRGDEAELPPPAAFTEGWRIGQPDRVISMAAEFEVPATGTLPYQYFVADPRFEEDVWVQAAEARPGNRAVVHHILVYEQYKGKRIFYEPDGTAAVVAGWAPGDMPAQYKPGTAKRLRAGSKLVFEVHYTPNGTKQTDRSSLGLIISKQPPHNVVEVNVLAYLAIRIPPGDPSYQGQFTYTFRKDAKLLSFMPHMHLRGTSARYEAEFPDGRSETLLFVPDYDFNWQSVYRFAEPLKIPKGTKLRWIGQWDNSTDNPRNPDPTQTVGWGLQTWDEMMNGWMEVVWETESK
jgi:peroxiredoxin